MPERVGFKVLPISTKSRFLLRERPETVGEEQEPPCIYAGEASGGHSAPGRELAALCISAKLSLFPILQQPCYQLTVSIEGKKNICFTT